MLTKTESKVMKVLCGESKDKRSYLISPIDLLKMSGVDALTLTELDKIVKDLSSDGYFDLIYSDRRGEVVYCVSLTQKGKGYLRSTKLVKRNLIFRFVLTIGFAILSFVVGLILKALF